MRACWLPCAWPGQEVSQTSACGLRTHFSDVLGGEGSRSGWREGGRKDRQLSVWKAAITDVGSSRWQAAAEPSTAPCPTGDGEGRAGQAAQAPLPPQPLAATLASAPRLHSCSPPRPPVSIPGRECGVILKRQPSCRFTSVPKRLLPRGCAITF